MTDQPELLVDLLDQDVRWVSARGEEWVVPNMPETYIRRVVAFLERSAGEIEYAYGIRESLHGSIDTPDDVSDELQRDQRERAADPVAWLRTTRLMQRFHTLLAETEEGAPW